MRFFLIWFFLSLIAAVIAHGKGRSAVRYFLLSLIASPLIGLPAALLVPAHLDRVTKKCLRCATRVPTSILICPVCQQKFPEIIEAEISKDLP